MEKSKLDLKKLEESEDGIYLVDESRKIIYWNLAACQLTGYSKEEMVGKHCYESGLDHISMDERHLCRSLCPLMGTMFDGKTRKEEVLVQTKDRSRVLIQVETYSLEEDGKIVGAMELFRRKETGHEIK